MTDLKFCLPIDESITDHLEAVRNTVLQARTCARRKQQRREKARLWLAIVFAVCCYSVAGYFQDHSRGDLSPAAYNKVYPVNGVK